MSKMTPFRYAIVLFAAPWLFGIAFDGIVYLRVPNPLEWDKFARGFALLTSFVLLITVWPWTFVLNEMLEDET